MSRRECEPCQAHAMPYCWWCKHEVELSPGRGQDKMEAREATNPATTKGHSPPSSTP